MKQLKASFGVILPVLFLLNGLFCSVLATEDASQSLDLVIKISDLDEKLDLVNSLAGNDPSSTGSPAAFVKQMLQGTEWIDPNRVIVLGGTVKQDQFEAAVLIPFKTPNPDFQTAMNASAGPDYYVFGFPRPGAPDAVPEALENALVASSKTGTKDFFSLEISINQLLQKGDKKIQEFIESIGDPSKGDPENPLDMSEEEIKKAAQNFISTASQIDILAERIDFNQNTLNIASELMAKEDSDLFWIFSRSNNVRFLDKYKPNRQMNFSIGQYDIQGFTKIINAAFGMIYKKMGIDFDSLAELMNYFNGEMAGGFDLTISGMQFEMISVLNEKKIEDDFIEEVYLPWLKNYMDSMNAAVEPNDVGASESVFLRMPDTEIEGYKVFGGMLQMPMFGEIVQGPSNASNPAFGQMFFKMARVGKYLLFAPDDKRIGELIELAGTFTETADQGPFMVTEMDLDAYLNLITEGFKDFPNRKNLPKIGKIKYITNAENGRMTTKASLDFQKIRDFITLYQSEPLNSRRRAPLGPGPNPHDGRGEQIPEKEPSVQEQPIEESPSYWADKAGLSATYGNNAAAVKYYTKAVSLDPERSDFYYFMGVSYGELGKFDQAMENINKAISMNKFDARYLYGRGRVYLKVGNEAAAMKDFNKAAAAGNQDAQQYLMYKSSRN